MTRASSHDYDDMFSSNCSAILQCPLIGMKYFTSISVECVYLDFTDRFIVWGMALGHQPRLIREHWCVWSNDDEVFVLVDQAAALRLCIMLYDITQEAMLIFVVVLLSTLKFTYFVVGYNWKCNHLTMWMGHRCPCSVTPVFKHLPGRIPCTDVRSMFDLHKLIT